MTNDLAWLLIIAVGMCGLGIASIVDHKLERRRARKAAIKRILEWDNLRQR